MGDLIIIDGVADWATIEDAIQEESRSISFLHCVSYISSLVMNDIRKIPQVAKLFETVIDCQD